MNLFDTTKFSIRSLWNSFQDSPARLAGDWNPRRQVPVGGIAAVALMVFGSLTLDAQAQVLGTNSGARSGTVLIFEPGDDLTPVPDSYGDRVTSPMDAHGNRYAPGSGGTSNITVEYGPAGSHARMATGPYGSLDNVACQEDGDFGVLEILLTADAGYQVALRGFDLGALVDDVIVTRVEVMAEHGVALHTSDDLLVPGFDGKPARFDFTAAPLVSGSVLIRIDLSSLDNTDSHHVGIDNISFSQIVGSGCPPPPRLTIARSGRNIVLSWPGPGYRLEMATALGGPPASRTWTAVAGASPVTLPMAASGAQFFRLVCP